MKNSCWSRRLNSCLLGHPYFKENYKLIAVDLNKQQALDADPKAVHEISFNKNLEQAENATMFFIHEEVRETVLHFSQGAMRVL